MFIGDSNDLTAFGFLRLLTHETVAIAAELNNDSIELRPVDLELLR